MRESGQVKNELNCKISIATNVGLADSGIIRHTVPHWLRVFGERVGEVVIIVDEAPPEGRIVRQHKCLATKSELVTAVETIAQSDPRIRWRLLPSATELDGLSQMWFGETRSVPVRCQAGTPIIAFLVAIDEARNGLMLRLDCDMLLHERGWLRVAMRLIKTKAYDLVEPWRATGKEARGVSTRALLLDKYALEKNRLPIVAHRLDLVRRIHRRIHGRTTWLALEQMLTKECHAGRVKHTVLGKDLGLSLHVADRTLAESPQFVHIIGSVEAGVIPDPQLAKSEVDPLAWQTL